MDFEKEYNLEKALRKNLQKRIVDIERKLEATEFGLKDCGKDYGRLETENKELREDIYDLEQQLKKEKEKSEAQISLLQAVRDMDKEYTDQILKMSSAAIKVAFDMKYDDTIDQDAIKEIEECQTWRK